ncbi:hypothetical protein DV735_g2082, partial [Chaetothyriales sp. CBS 134920]
MSTLFQTAPASPFDHARNSPTRSRTMAVIAPDPPSPKSGLGEAVRIGSPQPTAMGPPSSTSPDSDLPKSGNSSNSLRDQNGTIPASNSGGAPLGSPGGAQGPKVVQTAFIHKLYSMLEDRSIQHLISWSNNNDSFVMSPSSDFSKVLAQYFKHTNISSFVRQLNMYGFHKVSDVFHTGSAESAQWEFKHGNGSFKKGDLIGLRDIKRRASRHTLIHRDSFSAAKPGPSQPSTPAELVTDPDQRLAHLEYALSDVHNRLSRSEESYSQLGARCQALTDSLARCYQCMNSISGAMQSVGPSDSALQAEISSIQKEIARQLEYVRALDTQQDMLGSGRLPFYAGNVPDPPISPRTFSYPDSRRSSIQLEPQHVGIRPPVPPIPVHFATSPRKFGSLSGPTQASPGFSRPFLPPSAQQNLHPLASVVTQSPSSVSSGPGLARRHTSADIREHGWPPPQPNGSPYASTASSSQWQSSSPQQSAHCGDQNIRDQLAKYEIDSHRRPPANQTSSPDGPRPGSGAENVPWSLSAAKFRRSNTELHSAPPTRRSSMASNVHSLLNPAETVERDDEDGPGPLDDRKRKRLQ